MSRFFYTRLKYLTIYFKQIAFYILIYKAIQIIQSIVLTDHQLQTEDNKLIHFNSEIRMNILKDEFSFQ